MCSLQCYVVTMLLLTVWLVLGTKNTWDRKEIMFWLSWPSRHIHGLKISKHFVLFLQVVPMSHLKYPVVLHFVNVGNIVSNSGICLGSLVESILQKCWWMDGKSVQYRHFVLVTGLFDNPSCYFFFVFELKSQVLIEMGSACSCMTTQ